VKRKRSTRVDSEHYPTAPTGVVVGWPNNHERYPNPNDDAAAMSLYESMFDPPYENTCEAVPGDVMVTTTATITERRQERGVEYARIAQGPLIVPISLDRYWG